MRLAPGLHRIGDDVVAAYLVVADDGLTLIDAGLPGHRGDLRRELAALHLPTDAIKGVVLTHGDSDHRGFAERLRQELGIPVFVGEADAARAQGAKPPPTPRDRIRIGPLLRFLVVAIRNSGFRVPPIGEVRAVRDGDVLDLPGSPRILGMPGHSPGSIAVVVPSVRAVLVGDALTTRHVLTGSTGPQPAPFTDDQAVASASIERLRGLDVEWIGPGHGPAWHGDAESLVEAYRAAESAAR